MRKCPKCGLPETFETIELPADGGACNLCVNHDITTGLPWAERKRELDALIDKYRGRHEYDLILPFSGAKDSTWALYYLMTEYHIKPLVVRVDHGFMRPKMLKNVERTLKKLGADFLSFTPNWKLVKRVMLEAFIRKTDFCWPCHTSIFSYPMTLAIKYNTPLIMWGEPSSSYTAYFDPSEKELVDETRFDRFVNLGITADDMSGMGAKTFRQSGDTLFFRPNIAGSNPSNGSWLWLEGLSHLYSCVQEWMDPIGVGINQIADSISRSTHRGTYASSRNRSLKHRPPTTLPVSLAPDGSRP